MVVRGSDNNVVGIRRGASPNSVREAFRLQRALGREAQRQQKIRRVIVQKYRHSLQRVDVLPLDDPNGAPIKNVPIRNGGNGIRLVTPLKSNEQDGEGEGDIGYLIYADNDSHENLRSKKRTADHVAKRHRPIGPEFWPGAHNNAEDPIDQLAELAVNIHGIEPDDTAMVVGEMAVIFRRDRGDGKSQLILVADDIVALAPTQTESDLEKVARDGDPGDGTGGSITGTGVLRSG